ncbi:peptidoglycan-binding protein [Luteibacter sp. 3190]|uniref:peptidoglycan-binding protein n=1 Tax=Luteibacter sp. 3190 TaxID=2817736 RepID=UPI002861CF76|nr:peptidoglycan-binding protein [Luteibacter sp. 3190]MDR6937867.1 peptidoglycan hydrolase-like protein with peptidoglycan-binding domain [Luteibacter sp. 3190]
MVDRESLNERELKAIAYFAVGVASEGTDHEKDVSAKLSFAGRIVNGLMQPAAKSGISIGTLQKDLGQDGQVTAKAMVAAYQAWAERSAKWPALSDADVVVSVDDLSREGEVIREQGGRNLDPSLRAQLDAYLASKDGRDFVHARDIAQTELLYKRALVKMAESAVFKNADLNEKIILATVVAKAYNQNPSAGKALFQAMIAGPSGASTLANVDDVLAYAKAHHRKYLASGRDHALKGAEVLTRLHHSDANSPIGLAWREVLIDPLVRPTEIGTDAARPDLAAHYTLIKNLFHAPGKAKAFLDALEQGRPHHEARAVGSGFYTDGTQIVQWNADGKGVTFIDGRWATVSRDDLVIGRPMDGRIEVALRIDGELRPLLQVAASSPDVARSLRPGARGDDVRQFQEELSRLGYTDARGRPLHADGHYGPGTQAAVLAFQREHGLAADGICGKTTRAGVRQALVAGEGAIGVAEAAYRQPTEAMATYRALGPTPTPADASLTPAAQPVARERGPDAPPVDATPTTDALGTPDADGRPLAMHEELATAVSPSAVAQDGPMRHNRGPAQVATASPAPSDPRHADHPQNGLYELLKTQLPDASENRLLQTAAACHRSRITAENLSMVHINEETMTLHVFGHGPMTLPARVDLNHPSPAPEQSVERMAQFDLQQAQVLAEIQAQLAQMSRGLSR